MQISLQPLVQKVSPFRDPLIKGFKLSYNPILFEKLQISVIQPRYGIYRGIKEIACAVEFSGVFDFGLGFSKGSNTILWNIQELRFVLFEICRGKVKKFKTQVSFQKSISSTPPPPLEILDQTKLKS